MDTPTTFELNKVYKIKNPQYPYQAALRYRVIEITDSILALEAVDADRFLYKYTDNDISILESQLTLAE